MTTAKKSKSTPRKKAAAPKAAKKAPARKTAAAPKTKAASRKRATLKPKPKATHPSKKDVGIFGAIQKNIQEGIAVITETILPTPKKKSRRS